MLRGALLSVLEQRLEHSVELCLTFSSQFQKDLLTGNNFSLCPLVPLFPSETDIIGPPLILSVIHTVTICTMLNFNGGNKMDTG